MLPGIFLGSVQTYEMPISDWLKFLVQSETKIRQSEIEGVTRLSLSPGSEPTKCAPLIDQDHNGSVLVQY